MKKVFDGTIGIYTDYDCTIELKEDAKHFSIPKIHELNLKKKSIN